MRTITWNSLEFDFLNTFSKGRTLNAQYYGDSILTALIPAAHRSTEESLLFMQTLQSIVQLNSAELFVSKLACSPPHTGHTRVIRLLSL
jgi:hypothetical protein